MTDSHDRSEEARNEGNEEYKRGNYKEAVNYYSQAIELAPENVAYYSNRAAAYVMLNKWSEALADCEKALSLDPKCVKAYLRAGKCYLQLGQFSESTHHYRKAVELEPNNAQAAKELQMVETIKRELDKGKQYIQQEKYSEARASYSALQSMIDIPQTRLGQAEVLIGMKRYGEASRIVSDVLQAESSNMDALALRAKCLYYMGHLESAETLLRVILGRDPDFPPAQTLIKKNQKNHST